MKEILDHTNYEGYFLLYVDNELKAEEREAVELYTTLHPELKAELEDLLQTRQLMDETIFFPDKSKLLFSEITITDEDLLTYIDGEQLDELKRRKLENPSPSIKQRMEVFTKIAMEPDTSTVFPDKKKLIKQEKVFAVKVWKMASVAAVLLIAFGISFYLQDQMDRNIKNRTVSQAGVDLPLPHIHNRVTLHSDIADTDKKILESRASVEREKDAISSVKKNEPQKPGRKKLQTIATVNNNSADFSKIVQQQATAVTRKPDVVGRADVRSTITEEPELAVKSQPHNDVAVNKITNAVDERSVKRKKSLFKSLGNSIKNRALDVFANGDEDGATIAGFAVNVSR